MAGRQWYAAIGGKQNGPFSDERIRELIASGTVTADTLVWCEGMTNWTRAGAVPGLVSEPPRPAASSGVPDLHATDAAGATGPLSTTVRTWPLLGRGLLLGICQILVIPLPWALPSFLRWFVERIELPGGKRMTFAGRPGDIWYILILYDVICYASASASAWSSIWWIGDLLSWLLLPLTTLFALIIARWFYANLSWDGSTTPLRFSGGYLAMLGWSLLATISFISIIGWAWVYTAWTRWMCANVNGSVRKLVFTASGWSYLWRTLLLGVSFLFIVPIPWTFRWYVAWLVSKFALVDVRPGTVPLSTSPTAAPVQGRA